MSPVQTSNRELQEANEIFRWIEQNHTMISSVVLDEAHTILTAEDFRKIMDRADITMNFKVPVVLLTATLPKTLEIKLAEKIKLPTGYNIIRAPSNRIEHQYSVFSVGNGEDALIKRTAALMVESTKLLTGTRRGIVFTSSKAKGNRLKEYIQGIDFIHGSIHDESVRGEMMLNWKVGKTGGWLIGTSSLIQGVDYPDVNLVIFMGVPWGMIDFAQGAGRSGRNGSVSQVILLHDGRFPAPKPGDCGCQTQMNAWVQNSTECRRIGISECLDGESATCSSLRGATPCDVCEPDSSLMGMVNDPPLGSSDRPVRLPPLRPPSMDRLSCEPTQLEVSTLRPRNASSAVLRVSAQQSQHRKARSEVVLKCISTLRTFGTKRCIVCWFFGESANEKHKMCLNRHSRELRSMYEMAKPVFKKKDVRCCHTRTLEHTLTP